MTDLEQLVKTDAIRWWNSLAPDMDVTDTDIVDIYWSCYIEDMEDSAYMENQYESICRQG